MVAPGVNSLVSLLGLKPAEGPKAKPADIAEGSGSKSFANILELLASTSKVNQLGASKDTLLGAGQKSLLDQILSPAEKTDDSGLSLTKAAWNALTGGVADDVEAIDSRKHGSAADAAALAEQPVSAVGKKAAKNAGAPAKGGQTLAGTAVEPDSKIDIKSLLAGTNGLINRQLADLVSGKTVPVDLMSGTYEVLDSRLRGNELVLEVQSLDKQHIKVTIDARLLMQSKLANRLAADGTLAKSGLTPDRIQLNAAHGRHQQQLNELFSKLDIKALEVAQVDPDLRASIKDNASKPMVDLKLVTGNGAQEVLIKSRLRKGDLRAETARNSRSRAGGRSIPNLARLQAGSSNSKLSDANVLETARPVTQSMRPISSLVGGGAAALENLFGPEASPEFSSDQLYADQMTESMPKSGRVLPERTNITSTRITLPDDLAQSLKPNGKSVSIKIEPEHLGTARLKLTMHNEILTARLTVESTEARAVVESSLDQLTDQLEKAGIKINDVQVNVSGGDVDRDHFGHRAGWKKAAGVNHNRIKDVSETEVAEQGDSVARHTPTYIRPDQVNVFA